MSFRAAEGAAALATDSLAPPSAASCDSFAFLVAASSIASRLAFSNSVFTCGRTVRNLATVMSNMRMRLARASTAWLGSFRRRKMDSTRWCMRRTHVIWMLTGSVASCTFLLNM